MKPEQKQLYGSVALVVIFSSMMFLGGYNYANATAKPMTGTPELYVLENQYLGTLDGVPDGDSEDYLIMECSKPFSSNTGKQVFYFENEHKLRDDLRIGKFITIRWVYENGNYHIREVEEVHV